MNITRCHPDCWEIIPYMDSEVTKLSRVSFVKKNTSKNHVLSNDPPQESYRPEWNWNQTCHFISTRMGKKTKIISAGMEPIRCWTYFPSSQKYQPTRYPGRSKQICTTPKKTEEI